MLLSRGARAFFVYALIVGTYRFAVPADAQFVPSGDELQVNVYTPGYQKVRDVARLASGEFVVAYESEWVDIVGRRLDAVGQPLGTEFMINVDTATAKSGARIAVNPGGGFTVAWRSYFQDGDRWGVFARSFDAFGSPVTAEFQVNTYTAGDQTRPDIETLAPGAFVVVWSSCAATTTLCEMPFFGVGGQDGNGPGIIGQRIDAAGTKIGTEFQVNSYTTNVQVDPALAVAPFGEFFVAWSSAPQGIVGRRFDANGLAAGTEAQLSVVTAGTHSRPQVASNASGEFLVVWRHQIAPSPSAVFGRRVDALGTPIDGEIVVNDTDALERSTPESIAATPDGGFVVTFAQDRDVYGRAFDTNGLAKGPQLLLNDVLESTQLASHVAVDTNGNFVVGWESYASDQSEVVARHFCSDDDPACDRCLGHDDSIDGDGDGVPDGCDPCTNVGSARTMTDARVLVRRLVGSEIPVKSNRVRILGSFTIAGAFADFDPASDGARARIESSLGGEVLDVTLPPGAYAGSGTAGWRSNGTGTLWRFIDHTGGAPNGVSKIIVRDAGGESPGLVKVTLKGAGGIYPVSERYVPLKAIFTLGDQAASEAGQCGESAFVAPDCDTTERQMVCGG